MLLSPQRKLLLSPYSNCSRIIFMGSKNFLLLKSSAIPATHARILSLHSCSSCSQTYSFHSNSAKNLIVFASRKHVPAIYQKASGYSYTPFAAMPIPRPIPDVDFETLEKQLVDDKQLMILRQKLQEIGIDANPFKPGQYNGLICPRVLNANTFDCKSLSILLYTLLSSIDSQLCLMVLNIGWMHVGSGLLSELQTGKCKGGDSGEKSLSLRIEEDGGAATWTCFRAKCGWTGATRAFAGVKSTYARMNTIPKVKQPTRVITEESLGLEPLCNELLAYFAERMISGETLRRNSVMQKRTGIRLLLHSLTEGMKRYTVDLNVLLVMQEANTEKIFYGLDDIKEASDIIIVEGEMDKLAMEEAGFKNCVSVPDGAPPKVSNKSLPSEEEASRIILATDGDPPGQALAEELARRLGRERCWRVKWPKKNDSEIFKDANEVLMYMGPDALRGVIENAELYPIRGLFNFKDYFEEINDYYHQSLGFELECQLDGRLSMNYIIFNTLVRITAAYLTVVPGELTIVTGVPNSGKSEWIDALLCNLNHSVGWKFALCSMENRVREHARKLLEKHIRKPFFDVRYGETVERMSVEELEQGKRWLSDSFALIRCENDCLPSINWVLDLARIAVLRHGVNGLVIDPYNELDHQRPPNQDPEAGPIDIVQVCVRKVRNKVIGTIGDAYLSYNRIILRVESIYAVLTQERVASILNGWNLQLNVFYPFSFTFGAVGGWPRFKLSCSHFSGYDQIRLLSRASYFSCINYDCFLQLEFTDCTSVRVTGEYMDIDMSSQTPQNNRRKH
ncbi:hypothetical protein DH2020_042424 [Rehmannia glutinosa]|uniref:Toprim domain-containing protein n=1 Tax=Rehmannia glutinosa TaxID=99300 RepID=A0ABR0UN14_REHGL